MVVQRPTASATWYSLRTGGVFDSLMMWNVPDNNFARATYEVRYHVIWADGQDRYVDGPLQYC
jgi:hypothetical protein